MHDGSDHVVAWLGERQCDASHRRHPCMEFVEAIDSLLAKRVEVRRICGVKTEVAVRIGSNPAIEGGAFERNDVLCNIHRGHSFGCEPAARHLQPRKSGPAWTR